MLFPEQDSEWRTVQPWMDFLNQFGYGWRLETTGPRRILLISMPCDSAAAGLVALGAMVRRQAFMAIASLGVQRMSNWLEMLILITRVTGAEEFRRSAFNAELQVAN